VGDRGEAPDHKGWFATTRWSLVLAAGDSRDSHSEEALAKLCEEYWPPVYSYIRSRGHGVEEARDLTQAFFTLLLEKSYLKQVRRERGRFRSFLLMSVKHFLANEWDRERALKRGGGVAPLSLDIEESEGAHRVGVASGDSPEEIYEKRWALAVLARVLGALEREMGQSGNLDRFHKLRPYLTAEGGGVRYREVARDLGMSEAAVKVAIHRLRRRYGELLRRHVSQTVDEPDAVDAEIRHLLSALSG